MIRSSLLKRRGGISKLVTILADLNLVVLDPLQEGVNLGLLALKSFGVFLFCGLLGGNQFGFLPQFGRLDASFGQVLINKGKRRFEVLSTAQAGVELRGQVRDIVAVKGKVRTQYLFLQNDQRPVLFRPRQQAVAKN